MTTTVHFEEAGHIYTDHAGVEVPSVTQVIKNAGFSDYSGIDPEILERKGRLGTQVHRATRFYDEDDLDFSSMAEEIENYVHAWITFRAQSGFKPALRESEKPRIVMVNGMRFGMTPDATGFIGKDLYIIDKKCSAQEECWWKLQLAGYESGLRSEDQKFRRRMAVQLRPDGTYRTFPYADAIDYQIFNSALAIEWWKRQNMRRTA